MVILNISVCDHGPSLNEAVKTGRPSMSLWHSGGELASMPANKTASVCNFHTMTHVNLRTGRIMTLFRCYLAIDNKYRIFQKTHD